MGYFTGQNYWAIILGGSSGFGLAAAKKLATEGMNLCILHRDRRAELPRINSSFESLKREGINLISYNIDAIKSTSQELVINALKQQLKSDGKVHLLLHSIAKGNLKAMVDLVPSKLSSQDLSTKTSVENDQLVSLYQQLDSSIHAKREAQKTTLESQDFKITIEAMGSSLFDWTATICKNSLFSKTARVISITSEGNKKAWRNYAAISAAKATLEAITRSIALEFAPLGIRANVIQAGITDSPSLNMIDGSDHIKLNAILRNPYRRLTKPEDIAAAIYLLTRKESDWINGALIPVDGGESNC